jgi:hypothetical protein
MEQLSGIETDNIYANESLKSLQNIFIEKKKKIA